MPLSCRRVSPKMASPEPTVASDPRDWELLASLFAQGGAYRHRMGLRRFPTTEFYAPTPAGQAIRSEKEAILGRAGERHTLVTPEGHDAATEFARLLHLPAGAAVATDEAGRRAFNRQLGVVLEPDLLLVQPPDWSLVWANVCFPSRWSLEGKIQRPLMWIHDAVPNLNVELADKIGTFFARLEPGEGWRRANWGLSASALRNQHPDEPIPALEATTEPERVFIRVEDQHLVKLPGTGSVAFGIRIASFAWADVMARPTIAGFVVKKLRSMPDEITRYKGLERFISAFKEKR